MIVAGFFYYKKNKEEIDLAAVETAKRVRSAGESAGSLLLSTSSEIVYQAQRCYSDQQIVSPSSLRGREGNLSYNMTSLLPSTLKDDEIPGIFLDNIRQEWIDAIFGTEFYNTRHYDPPKQGVGRSRMEHYLTFTATIDEKACEKGDKVGVMLSRIALGLYVQKLEIGSEAYYAGVEEGSVLIDINGMGMLGEASKQALERIWQYEGHFDRDLRATENYKKDTMHSNDNTLKEPTVFKFIKNGQVYSCVMFSNPPYGITWAPCGQFPLVQKVYSFAEEAGAKKGSLLVAVNEQSIRQLNHKEIATRIRSLFIEGKRIDLTFAYTPAVSRSAHFENLSLINSPAKSNSKIQKRTIASVDGVEVRTHPLEYGKLFTSVGDVPHVDLERQKVEERISELAAQVAAAQRKIPSSNELSSKMLPLLASGNIPKSRHFRKCPTFPKHELLNLWDPVDSLFFSVLFYKTNYREDCLAIETGKYHRNMKLDGLQQIMLSNNSWKIAKTFLLQWVSLICNSEEVKSVDGDESTDFQCSRKLSSILLDVSLHSDEFCQDLYFILRSYIATLEGQRKKDNSNSNLLTVLQALERLRSVQKQLGIQLTSCKDIPFHQISCSALQADSPKALEEVSTSDSNQPIELEVLSEARKNGNGKSLFQRFKKKKKKKKFDLSITPTESTVSSEKTPPSNEISVVPQNSQVKSTSCLSTLSHQLEQLSVSSLLENMTQFLTELDRICDKIEGSLLKSISQKIAVWALQPWTASKESELAEVTEGMRDGLKKVMISHNSPAPLANPVDSSEVLVSIDTNECYILPSAHFPLLLTFNVNPNPIDQSSYNSSNDTKSLLNESMLYKTNVQIVAIYASAEGNETESLTDKNGQRCAYVVQAAIAGNVKESGKSNPIGKTSKNAVWEKDGSLTFETRSCWGAPNTLSLSIFNVGLENNISRNANFQHATKVGNCWIDMKPTFEKTLDRELSRASSQSSRRKFRAKVWTLESSQAFNEHGEIEDDIERVIDQPELEVEVEIEMIPNLSEENHHSHKRMLLYKHNDDLRQEMFAIQFIDLCGSILKASGLDLKLLTFRCISVGHNRGFIEWIPGSVPLSDICQSFAGNITRSKASFEEPEIRKEDEPNTTDQRSEVAKAGLVKYQSLQHRNNFSKGTIWENSLENNPIQDFFRSVAYDHDAPYFIKEEVMDNYIKSCAGYCVLTYLLGVGDRHLDNLLLHQNGNFFHCDYSFILGNDPKKYLPMRITEDMVLGMGGLESDGYALFLSLAGATFTTLRRHENVRTILSLIRLMVPSMIPDISINQKPIEALNGVKQRLRLDLSEEESITYVERLIEDSLNSKVWIAVDAMHNIGKHF